MTSRRRVLRAAAAAGMSLLAVACRREDAAAPRLPPAHAGRGSNAKPLGLRIDLRHIVQGADERFELVELKREAEAPSLRTDAPDWGDYRLTIADSATNTLRAQIGFDSSVDAGGTAGTATVTLRSRFPDAPFTLTVAKRRPGGVFQPLFASAADASLVHEATAPPVTAEALIHSGAARDKVDVAFVGDGYAAHERVKFLDDARRAASYLFSVEPFRTRSRDFNVHAIFAASEQSGITDAYLGVRRASAFGSSYGSGYNERTLSVGDERRLRDAASAVAYDFLLVIANSRRYGGSAYFGGPAVVAIDSAAARYLVLHELAHAIAGLAEEYYIPTADGPAYRGNVEPWQPNVTTSPRSGKWTPASEVPSAWNKAQYERYFSRYVQRYGALRAGGADERKVEKLMRDAAARQAVLLGRNREVGLFEGANGYSTGVFRSEADCIMFSLQTEYFCAACTAALSRAIDAHLPK